MLQQNQPFSWGWILASVGIFVITQLVLAYIVGQVLLGARIPHGLQQMVQGFLMLLSYFVGGFLIGVVSPKIRIIEPALGAFASIFLVVIFSFLMPNSYVHFEWLRLLIGGVIAFGLAMYGAVLGEKLTKQLP
ncbi:MAG TPA: hypothetical protein PKL69_06230 [Agitococcus sp.]|nr:hypothetical protein [Agitococcus sp.]HMX99917.1 hypothetical protein [Agitococcus sp.]HMY82555.1 hypothetical protein [Agitococcus sp.]HNA20504.1 hypothetical protein [Agitococcus sp.]HNB19677.1 hypothetical protein [Agitococcus sp.]